MSGLFTRGNDVLEHNAQVAVNNLTDHGSSLNWAIFALHAVLFLGFLGWTFVTPPRRRIFHYISVLILFFTTILYFVLASNLGSTAVRQYLHEAGIINRTRQVFYARWVAYLLNFALAAFALQLLAAVDWASVWFTVFLVFIWASLYQAGALTSSSYRWGFFGIAVFTHVLIGWMTLGVGRGHIGRIEQLSHTAFSILAVWEVFMMMLYAVAWACSEGSNSIPVDSGQIFYCILDTLSFGVFTVLLVLQTKKLDLDYLRLSSHENGRLRDSHGILSGNGQARRTHDNDKV